MHLVALQSGWYRAISMSCVTLPKWHGRGHRFDPDQVHQQTLQYQRFTGTTRPPSTPSRMLRDELTKFIKKA
jgi:hypothetical protein